MSGRASDLQSQPMSGIEEGEEREHELYRTETFPPAGVAAPLAARSPSPPPAAHRYVNIDEELREDVRKEILALQRPVLNMMRQIAGAANMEYHRIVKQEVTEEAVDFVFKLRKESMIQKKAEERAQQWFEDACKANTIFEPTPEVVNAFRIGVYLRLKKFDDTGLYALYVGFPRKSLVYIAIQPSDTILRKVGIIHAFLVKQNVFNENMEHDNSQPSMTQAAELSKFNLSELRDIVENYVIETPVLSESEVGRLYPIPASKVAKFSVKPDVFPFGGADGGLEDAESESNRLLRRYIEAFLRTEKNDVTEIDARVDAHIDEASQLVYDTLSSRGGEDRMRNANTVRNWMLRDVERTVNNGPRLLFARLVANRYSLSQDLVPKQHYLQVRFGRLRQQAAILLVNLRRLHYKNGRFTLDTSIPRRSLSIY